MLMFPSGSPLVSRMALLATVYIRDSPSEAASDNQAHWPGQLSLLSLDQTLQLHGDA